MILCVSLRNAGAGSTWSCVPERFCSFVHERVGVTRYRSMFLVLYGWHPIATMHRDLPIIHNDSTHRSERIESRSSLRNSSRKTWCGDTLPVVEARVRGASDSAEKDCRVWPSSL
mmetsp:Transcript_18466/g.51507  ORF Transcript_18466/g.51507 Transcript_18466/m.51507 type:complete len:115 (-) Transcript_18466:1240-1584(-)